MTRLKASRFGGVQEASGVKHGVYSYTCSRMKLSMIVGRSGLHFRRVSPSILCQIVLAARGTFIHEMLTLVKRTLLVTIASR